MGTASSNPAVRISGGQRHKFALMVALADAVRAARTDPLARRGRRVVLALVLIWLLNIFDLSFTLLAHQIGGFEEVNFLARELLDASGALVAFKLTALLVASLIFLALRRHWLAELACWALCFIYSALAIVWLTYYTVLS